MPENGRNLTDEASSSLRTAITAIDQLVPRDGAWVELTEYGGGPDEGQISGNRDGYRRLGIEFLKATIDVGEESRFQVDLEYLVSPNSTINFDWFEVSETRPHVSVQSPWRNRLVTFGCATFCVTMFSIFVIGLFTVVQWLGW